LEFTSDVIDRWAIDDKSFDIEWNEYAKNYRLLGDRQSKLISRKLDPGPLRQCFQDTPSRFTAKRNESSNSFTFAVLPPGFHTVANLVWRNLETLVITHFDRRFLHSRHVNNDWGRWTSPRWNYLTWNEPTMGEQFCNRDSPAPYLRYRRLYKRHRRVVGYYALQRAIGVRKGTEPIGPFEYDSDSELDDFEDISREGCNGYDNHSLRVYPNVPMKFPLFVYSNIDTWATIANAIIKDLESDVTIPRPTIRHFWLRLLQPSSPSAIPWKLVPMTTGQLAKIVPNLIPNSRTAMANRLKDHWTYFLSRLQSLSICVWGNVNVRRDHNGYGWDHQFGVYDPIVLHTYFSMAAFYLEKLEICIFHDHDPFNNRGISVTDITTVFPSRFTNLSILHIESTFLGDNLAPQNELYQQWSTVWDSFPPSLSRFTLKRCGFNTLASWRNFLTLTLTRLDHHKTLEKFELDEVYYLQAHRHDYWRYATVCWSEKTPQHMALCKEEQDLKEKIDVMSIGVSHNSSQGINTVREITEQDIRRLVAHLHPASLANFELNFKENDIDAGIFN
jgi:hypothetical protein